MSTGFVGVMIVVLFSATSGVSPRGPAAAVDASPAAAAPWTARSGDVVQSDRPHATDAGANRSITPRAGWRWPLQPEPTVMRTFALGPHPWSPGHRGVDLLGAAGMPVAAASAGIVTYTGMVAGRPVITVTHNAGLAGESLRTTYEPVLAGVAVGTPVTAGQVIGSLAPVSSPVETTSNVGAQASHCAPQVCLHWGAMSGQTYVDPLLLLRFRAPILLPWGE